MKLKTLLTTTLTSLMLVTTVISGMGQAIFTETFNYATPAYVGGNGAAGTTSNGWTTHSVTAGQTTTVDIQDGSLSYSGLAASVGNKVLLFSNANATSRDINAGFTTSSANAMYFSAIVNIVDNSQINTTGDYFMAFGATSGTSVTSLGGRLGIRSTNTGANFRFCIQNISTGTTTYTDYATDLTYGTSYLVVVKFDRSTTPTTATLWVNPTTLGGSEPAGSVFNNSGTASFTAFTSIMLRNSSTTPKAEIDEIRVGTTFADVTPVGVDATAPVATFNPTAAATGVSSAIVPTITFDEAIHNTSDGSLVTDADLTSLITFTETSAAGTAVPFTATIGAASKVITITPSASLTPGQLYYLAVAPVQDAAGNDTTSQSITFTTAATLSTATNITLFNLAGIAGTIDATAHTVSVVLPYGTAITAIEPIITLSLGASASPTGVQNFTSPVTYTVTAEDGITIMPWIVTVTFTAPEFTATYPKSTNIGKNQFDVVVNLKSAAKVYFLKLASGVAAPVSADIKATGTMMDITTAATDFNSTITGLEASTTYDVYFVTEDNAGTILMSTPIKRSFTTGAGMLTIHDIQYTVNASGDSQYKDQTVTTSGIVTAIKLNTTSGAQSSFYIQDGAGEWNGVLVYVMTPAVALGDKVTVTGKLVEYNKLTEFEATSVVTIDNSNNPLPAAAEITTAAASGEAYESVLVKVKNANCASGSAGVFVVNDGSGDLTIHKSLFATLELAISSKYDITGVMAWYNSSNIFELYPRSAADVVLVTGIANNEVIATRAFPNPFSNDFTINAGKVVRNVTVSNMLGQKVMERAYSESEISVPTSDLRSGIYLVNVKFEDGTTTTLRMVKK
ncbi:T9SS type A sorting domain-containing protein [Williamwhitmania taraxaci]|uniref:Por secretion system C-terminal sorting domain-containing protein n=1 Tax=Williamwhitmania taraxaci TaxID=1640674 RepID=A0A1G6GIW2_9BACT|nr:T9SS type A sorting domain-containing protein [Williamwhitmania taraxaci]SDB81685.1 Por secretion system C-terminal sorting domain-containing protein [Williamwhitmania taraxaci]